MAQLTAIEKLRIEEYQDKCTSCGACCLFFAKEEGMIGADGPAAENPELSYHRRDEKRFTWPDGDEEVHIDERMVMRTKTLEGFPSCIALEGSPGKCVGCSIYQIRPVHCRVFFPGSNQCLEARRWAGFEEEKS